MKTVGIRELKNRLSEYVRQVRTGEGVLVTARGEVVAELGPPGEGAFGHGLPAALVALSRKGAITLGEPNRRDAYPAMSLLLRRRRAQELLDEERGSR